METLGYIGDVLLTIEKKRVAQAVRISHLQKNSKRDKDGEEILEKLEDFEEWITEKMATKVKNHPAYWWFSCVKGVGQENIGKILAFIDIKRATHISSLWKWFGYSPNQKRRKGEKLDFNIKGKSMCWRLAGNLLKAKGKFYDYYLSEKEKFELRCINEGKIIKEQKDIKKKDINVISKGHIHNYALRKMIKRFLACLWLVWREAEGLPITPISSPRKDEGNAALLLFGDHCYVTCAILV